MLDTVFWVTCRDKEKKVELAVRSALAQKHPCRIVITDQGSKDLTRAVIQHVIKDYDGPHQVEFYDCPETQNVGHTGLNDHINWFHKNIEYDICIQCSCDDYSHPNRVDATIKAYEENNMPSMVLTAQTFSDPKGNNTFVNTGCTCYPTESRFVNGVEMIDSLIGGSSSQSWSREFMDKIYPLEGLVLPDVYMPFMATQSPKGCYYLSEITHSYIRWADEENTGLGGVLEALDDGAKKEQTLENIWYHLTNAYSQCAMKCMEVFPEASEEARARACAEIVKHAISWSSKRNDMTRNRIQPTGARI